MTENMEIRESIRMNHWTGKKVVGGGWTFFDGPHPLLHMSDLTKLQNFIKDTRKVAGIPIKRWDVDRQEYVPAPKFTHTPEEELTDAETTLFGTDLSIQHHQDGTFGLNRWVEKEEALYHLGIYPTIGKAKIAAITENAKI